MYLNYIDPDIGGIGHLLKATYPTVYLPNSMVGICPVFSPNIVDRYLADRIAGFPVPTHLHQYSGTPAIMPITGSSQGDPASEFDHDFEKANPHYYWVLLERYNIEAEYTVSEHCVFYRFTFPNPDDAYLLLANNGADLEFLDDFTIRGTMKYRELNSYFYIKANKRIVARDAQDDRVRLNFRSSSKDPLELKIGVSFISHDQAWRNLDTEILAKSFEDVKEEARSIWEKARDTRKVEGGTEKQKRMF